MAEAESQRARLKRFYGHYEPSKSDADIEKALERFAGKYDQMWTSLEKKYGKESSVPAPKAAAAAAAASTPAPAASPTPAAPAAAAATPAPAAAQASATASGGGGGGGVGDAVAAVTPVNVDAVRDRLARFYAHYAKEKTQEDIATAIAMFADGNKGGYEAMFAKLEQKYGLEKDIPESASVTLSPDEQGVYARLQVYYKHYGVARTDAEIKTALLRFRNGANGGYDQMWSKLYQKYGPDPGAAAGGAGAAAAAAGSSAAAPAVDPEAPRDNFDPTLEAPAARLRRFYDTHAPTKTDAEVRESLDRFVGPNASAAGGLSALWSKLADKYGAMPLPPPGYAQQWSRLRKYFNHYAPETKNSDIDVRLARACSTPTGVNTMWQNLIAQHGPEPLDPEVEKAMAGPTFISSRLLGDPPTAAMSPAPRLGNEFLRHSRAKTAGAAAAAAAGMPALPGLGAAGASGSDVEVVRLLIHFVGLDMTMLEDMPLDRRLKVADAIEQQIALNSGLQPRSVALTGYYDADAEIELVAEKGLEHQLFHAAATVVSRAVDGSFSVKLLREVLLRECKMNAIHVHAVSARVLKQALRLAPRPTVSEAAAVVRESQSAPPAPELTVTPEEAKAIRAADEVARMSQQQRMTHSWRKTLEDRLRGKGGTTLSYKRNNEAFREFLGNIWADTAAAFHL